MIVDNRRGSWSYFFSCFFHIVSCNGLLHVIFVFRTSYPPLADDPARANDSDPSSSKSTVSFVLIYVATMIRELPEWLLKQDLFWFLKALLGKSKLPGGKRFVRIASCAFCGLFGIYHRIGSCFCFSFCFDLLYLSWCFHGWNGCVLFEIRMKSGRESWRGFDVIPRLRGVNLHQIHSVLHATDIRITAKFL